MLINGGADIKSVQTLMRHSSPVLTLGIYLHSDNAVKDARDSPRNENADSKESAFYLATLELLVVCKNAPWRTRTSDPVIKSRNGVILQSVLALYFIAIFNFRVADM